jgi:hypothetical protein
VTLGPSDTALDLDGLFQSKMVRKLRQINESLIGYEPKGREFESLAHAEIRWKTEGIR